MKWMLSLVIFLISSFFGSSLAKGKDAEVDTSMYIFNSEEERLIKNGTITLLCKEGSKLNQSSRPFFNYFTISRLYENLMKEDYSSYGSKERDMKILVSNIKLSVIIKSMNSLCPEVF